MRVRATGGKALPNISTAFLSVAMLAVAAASVRAQTPAQDTSIRYIARTLNRLGETATAQRLLNDYFNTKKVVISDLSGEGTGVNSRTGRKYTVVGRNEMELHISVEAIGQSERSVARRPYGPSSPLVQWAATVMHEYVHMGQVGPKNVPRFEDPAYHAMDDTFARWAERLRTEAAAVQSLPSSPERTAKLRETGDLVNCVLSEAGSYEEAIGRSVAENKLSKGQTFRIGQTLAALRSVKTSLAGGSQALATAKPKPGTVPFKGWVLVQVDDFNKPPSDANYKLGYGRGSINWGWSLNKDVFNFTSTWSEPPKVIKPGDRVNMTIGVAVTANSGTDYSANGTFAVWFDRPDIEPGSVGAPIGFRNDKGEGGSFAVSHKQSISGSTYQRDVWADFSSLPKGNDGARMALLVDAYNGRSAGTRYIYEWRVLP